MNIIPPMRTGSNGFLVERENRDYIETVVQSILIIFFKNVCKNINMFCEHINMYYIPVDILRTFLRFECLTFIERNNINEEINEMIIYLNNIHHLEDENDDLESVIEISEDAIPNYNCNCDNCNLLRSVSDCWDTFNPNDYLIVRLKQMINEMTDDVLLDIFRL